ncbi:hypothetical protein SCACP_15820 [Sporomusa carbonis]|uniref:hypothetical protein n=1 Tax=Sporomusa carbonis TaxID=3076075 RepID=UPI003A5F4963
MFTYNPLYNKYGSFYLCYNPPQSSHFAANKYSKVQISGRCSSNSGQYKKPFKYPYYLLIPAKTVTAATQAFFAKNKPAKLSDERVMAEIADKLSADINSR